MDPSTQAGYAATLAAFKALFPAGAIDDSQGALILSANGKIVRVSGDDMYAAGQPGGPDAEQLVASWFSETSSGETPAPAPKPNASDAWRNAAPGTIITIAGVSYEVMESPFGNYPRKLKTPPPAPPVLTVADERQAVAQYAKVQLAAVDSDELQASWLSFLGWLSKR